MTIAVDLGRKANKQTNKIDRYKLNLSCQYFLENIDSQKFKSLKYPMLLEFTNKKVVRKEMY